MLWWGILIGAIAGSGATATFTWLVFWSVDTCVEGKPKDGWALDEYRHTPTMVVKDCVFRERVTRQ